MGSGLNGQQFAFHGYLPVKEKELTSKIIELEKESAKKNQTQIFIETPYRNNQLMNCLLKTLNPSTNLCVALDLTGNAESIICQSVKDWKGALDTYPKIPAIFLFLA
jgi:16S rRNA (cytidine1402-2'-O)-methyltransferase